MCLYFSAFPAYCMLTAVFSRWLYRPRLFPSVALVRSCTYFFVTIWIFRECNQCICRTIQLISMKIHTLGAKFQKKSTNKYWKSHMSESACRTEIAAQQQNWNSTITPILCYGITWTRQTNEKKTKIPRHSSRFLLRRTFSYNFWRNAK